MERFAILDAGRLAWLDAFGKEFFELAREGVPAYPMEALTPTRVAPAKL